VKIGGFQRFSLCDFPGCIAAIVFTQGCNFKCPFCHNADLIPPQPSNGPLVPESYVLEFLASRTGKLGGVVVTGGEPTLQKDLPAFLGKVHRMGYAVKLDTNGSRPEVLRVIIDNGLVDYIAMDIKAPLWDYDKAAGVKAPVGSIRNSIEMIARSGIEHEFRTTNVRSLLSDTDLSILSGMIPGDSKHTVQEFRPVRSRRPAAPSVTSSSPE
jgi:pyruvate formate lyase activating enzyme